MHFKTIIVFVEDRKTERAAHSLGPEGAVVAIVAGPVKEDPDSAKRLALNPPDARVNVVSVIVNQNAGSAEC